MTPDDHAQAPRVDIATAYDLCEFLEDNCIYYDSMACTYRLDADAVRLVEERDADIRAERDAQIAHAARSAALEEAAELSKRYLPGSYVKQNAQAVAAVRAYRDGIRALSTPAPRADDGGGRA